jgi:uncharacterized protein
MSNSALNSNLKIIDVDTHLVEPPDVWTSRVASKFLDQVPRVEKFPENGESRWRIGDEWVTSPGYHGLAGWPEYPPSKPVEYEDIDPGAWQADARLERMDEYGIYAQILYPNLIGFDTPQFMALGPELSLICTQAYNDFLIDFCSADRNRLIPISMVPFWDLDAAVAEIQRTADAGHKGVLFANRYERIGLPPFTDTYWNPVYNLLQDLELSVNYHIGFARDTSVVEARAARMRANPTPKEYARAQASEATETVMSNAETLRTLLTSDLCERFPRLKFVSVESGFGYIPYLLESLDWHWKSSGAFRELPTLPSEIFTRQCYGSFWFEKQTLRLLDLYPDNVMFETDYPHPTSLSPGPASPAELPIDHVRSAFADISPEITQKVLHDNAAAVYHL